MEISVGTFRTDRLMEGDRPSQVTVNTGSTVVAIILIGNEKGGTFECHNVIGYIFRDEVGNLQKDSEESSNEVGKSQKMKEKLKRVGIRWKNEDKETGNEVEEGRVWWEKGKTQNEAAIWWEKETLYRK